MPRIRMIKPEFFDDPAVADLTPFARLFFIGLWIYADKEGFVEDDIRRLKAKIFPYDDVDCNALAVELHGKDMIRRYPAVEKHGWIWIRNFLKHQRPHPKEPESVRPTLNLEDGKSSDPAVEKHGKVVARTSESLRYSLKEDIRNLDPKSGDPKSADADFEVFRQAYPVSRRVGGTAARRAFQNATKNRNGAHFVLMLSALEQHKRSEQWQTQKLIPLMTTWLNGERWVQVLPEPKGYGQTSKTANNANAIAAFVKGNK